MDVGFMLWMVGFHQRMFADERIGLKALRADLVIARPTAPLYCLSDSSIVKRDWFMSEYKALPTNTDVGVIPRCYNAYISLI